MLAAEFWASQEPNISSLQPTSRGSRNLGFVIKRIGVLEMKRDQTNFLFSLLNPIIRYISVRYNEVRL